MDRVRRLSLVALFAVQFAGAALVLAPATAVYAVGPLPDCRYDDIRTPRDEYQQWEQSLLDPIFMLPRAYSPNDLVGVGAANLSGTGKVRRVALDDLRAMARAAAKAGKPIAVQSAFRSYDKQRSLFNGYVRRMGFRSAALVSARPGHSEHQLGTTIDFKSRGGPAPWNVRDWASKGAGKWMKNNAWQYGWIMSYPKGKSPGTTCYRYEPWHYRYFGRDVARQIHESGLTAREWLWRQGYGAEEPGGAPSVPGNLLGEALGDLRVQLTWTASDGGIGAISYRIFRDGVRVAETPDTTYVDQPTEAGPHEYRIRAVDAQDAKSDFTETIVVEVF